MLDTAYLQERKFALRRCISGSCSITLPAVASQETMLTAWTTLCDRLTQSHESLCMCEQTTLSTQKHIIELLHSDSVRTNSCQLAGHVSL